MIRALFLLAVFCGTAGPAAADFLRNNLRMTLYHEVGHAVIDQARVLIFGPEENAADSFALVLAHRLHTEAEMAALVTDMTRLGRIDAEREFFNPWSEYMPGGQRLAQGLCLYYGMNPDVRGDMARALGLPAEEELRCEEYAEVVEAAWNAVLDDLAPVPGTRDSFVPDARGKALRVLAHDIKRLNDHIELPRPVPVEYEDCGEDNAFYYHWDERIVFCSEMVLALRGHMAR